MPEDRFTQVLIVGGSLVGLSAALFLADQKVPAITIEKHPGSSPHPRAIGYTTRTMELFRSVGLEGQIQEVPSDFRVRRVRVKSLASGEVLDESDWTPKPKDLPQNSVPVPSFSPSGMAAIAQDKLESILRIRAEELGAHICTSTELLSFEQDSRAVSARILDRASGQEVRIHAEYMIAADGSSSSIRRALNIKRSGRGHMRWIRSVLFRADLQEYLSGGILQWEIEQPDLKGFLTTYPDGRWVLMFFDDLERDDLTLEKQIHKAIGRDDIPVEIITTGRWDLSAVVSDRFSSGRVFLAGDAAHQLPPSRGGYGANTGIQDVHNLAWKLKAVLSGVASPSLLETYDAERRPIAWTRHEQIFARPDYAKDAQGWSERVNIIPDEAMELGQLYRSASIVGTSADLPVALRPSEWHGQPGTRAPHLLIERDGNTVSTLDLFGTNWVLLAQDEGWRGPANVASRQCGVQIQCYINGAEISAVKEDFISAYGIDSLGASLIRPDGFVAWRSKKPARETKPELKDVLEKILWPASS